MQGSLLDHTYQICSKNNLIYLINLPNSRLPIPYSRFPIPYSLLPTPYSLCYHQLSMGKAPGRTLINLVLPLRSTSTSNWAPTSEASTPC
ncbi:MULTISPECIES: hypothetical protein [unclassified Moorena]|uniref:hypothetical protein n=1 Tax=unclassified Moorena TaxID=2683338 RepID=UPI001401516B|nr:MULTISPECIES: hypothetical protein [unclassified Moorena]NEO11246.1 hypothetical protein [Moorena sp. SIO3E8]NEP98841.1 hypothetical protein [Moorena sp. SIO3F7]